MQKSKPLKLNTFFGLLSLIFLMISTSLTASANDSSNAVDGDSSLQIPYQKFILDNGLTLLVHQDSKAPIVAEPAVVGGEQRRITIAGDRNAAGDGLEFALLVIA